MSDMSMRQRIALALCIATDREVMAHVLTDAVLDAMREPTEAMLRSGPASDPELSPLQLPGEIARSHAAWVAMIDAAKAGA